MNIGLDKIFAKINSTEKPQIIEFWFKPNGIGITIILYLVIRISLSMWASFVLNNYPYSIQTHWNTHAIEFYEQITDGFSENNRRFHDSFLKPWFRWDSEWYLRIAVEGYKPGGSSAFAPIYPVLIRFTGSLLGGNSLLGAYLISNLATIICCILLYQETRSKLGSPTAERTVLFLLAFPTAFFLMSAYSESLFLLFVLIAWRFMHRHQWLWSLVFSALAILTRFQGIGLILPLVYYWYKSHPSNRLWGIAYLSLPLVFFTWGIYVHNVLGTEYPWEALEEYWNLRIGWPWEGYANNISLLINPSKHVITDPFSLSMDLLVATLFIILTVAAVKYLPAEYPLLMLVLFAPILFKVGNSGIFVSVSRYVLPLFPGFMVLGYLCRNKIYRVGWIVVSLTMQAIMCAAFILWVWVA